MKVLELGLPSFGVGKLAHGKGGGVRLPKLAAGITRVLANIGRAILAQCGDSTTGGAGARLAVGNGLGTQAISADNERAKSHPSQMALAWEAVGVPARADAVCGNSAAVDLAAYMLYNPDISIGVGRTFSTTNTVGRRYFVSGSTITTSDVFTPQKAADRLDVWYRRASGFGTMTVTDTSGTLATINQNGTDSIQKVTVTRAVASLEPFSIQRSAGGGVDWIILDPWNSTLGELCIWNMGWNGSSTSDWDDAANVASPANMLSTLTTVDAISIALGLNDKNQGVAAVTYQANLLTVAAAAKASGADVCMFKQHKARSTGSGYYLSPEYLAAVDAVGAALSLPPAIDAFNGLTLIPGDYYDDVHLSGQGYGKFAAFERAAIASLCRLL